MSPARARHGKAPSLCATSAADSASTRPSWWEPGATNSGALSPSQSSKCARNVNMSSRTRNGGSTCRTAAFIDHGAKPGTSRLSRTAMVRSWCRATDQLRRGDLSNITALTGRAERPNAAVAIRPSVPSGARALVSAAFREHEHARASHEDGIGKGPERGQLRVGESLREIFGSVSPTRSAALSGIGCIAVSVPAIGLCRPRTRRCERHSTSNRPRGNASRRASSQPWRNRTQTAACGREPKLSSQRARGSVRPSSCDHAAWVPRACGTTSRRQPRRSGNLPASRPP
jgi:hypothetical protein